MMLVIPILSYNTLKDNFVVEILKIKNVLISLRPGQKKERDIFL